MAKIKVQGLSLRKDVYVDFLFEISFNRSAISHPSSTCFAHQYQCTSGFPVLVERRTSSSPAFSIRFLCSVSPLFTSFLPLSKERVFVRQSPSLPFPPLSLLRIHNTVQFLRHSGNFAEHIFNRSGMTS